MAASCSFQALGVVAVWYLSIDLWKRPPDDRRQAGLLLALLVLVGMVQPRAHAPSVDWIDFFLWPVGIPLLIFGAAARFGRYPKLYARAYTEPGSKVFTISMCFCHSTLLIVHSLTHPIHVWFGLVPCLLTRMLITGPCWALLVLAGLVTLDELRREPVGSLVRLARATPVVRALLHPSFALFGLLECFR